MKRCLVLCLVLFVLVSCQSVDYTARYPEFFSDKDTEYTKEVKCIFLEMTESFNRGDYEKYIAPLSLDEGEIKSFVDIQKEIAATIKTTYTIKALDVEQWSEDYIVLHATKDCLYENIQNGEKETVTNLEKYVFERDSEGDWYISSSSGSDYVEIPS